MSNEQLIEEIKKLPELDFAVIVEAIFDRSIHENMCHIIHDEIEQRDFRSDEIESLHDELVEAGDKMDKLAFNEHCAEIEVLRLTKIIEEIKILIA